MGEEAKKRRKYLSQSDVPAYGLEHAMRVPLAIANEHGKQPTRPLLVAQAMELTPSASRFRMLCGAAIAYGLTQGGSNAKVIELTPLGQRIVAPTEEGDDEAAMREAVLRPRVLREFLTRYNGSPFPSEKIALNVLEEMGVPGDKSANTYRLIVDTARAVSFLRGHQGLRLRGPGIRRGSEADAGRAGRTKEPRCSRPRGPRADRRHGLRLRRGRQQEPQKT